ncbi:MAG: molybdopterin molybdotransferase MoeA [Rhodobacteraceae bacterium]|nr:molybdopterin molybdotransferase MoeA [Paracoccaceae bacterium]
MIPVAEATDRLLALVRPLPPETVPLGRAAGRVLAEDAVAARAQPPFDASAMDGYALRAAEARPGARFRVVGEAHAGRGFHGALGPGEAVRIFTGAPMPAGADRVAIQEDVDREGDTITLKPGLGAEPNVRPRGSDFAEGARMAAPRRLGPADLALLAAMNVPAVRAARRPEVALVATGDELVLPGQSPGPDQIVASNVFGLRAMAEAEGARVRMLPIARDDPAALRAVLALAAGADLIVTVGGASVGERDLVAEVAQAAGLELAFHRIAMRPGKPLMSGRMGAAVLIGLPGNPVSAMVCGELFLRPVLRAMQGLPDPLPRRRTATLAAALPANGPREHYMRARVENGAITAFERQDSALLSVLAEANALLVRPVSDPPRAAGETVDYLPI